MAAEQVYGVVRLLRQVPVQGMDGWVRGGSGPDTLWHNFSCTPHAQTCEASG